MSGHWFPTHNGKRIDLENIDPSQILIEDIAHALGATTRYNGHTRRPYSVAEHCVRLSYLCPSRVAALALMHDASEYIMCDVARPIKALMPEYMRLEKHLMDAILRKYGLDSLEGTIEATAMRVMDTILPVVEARNPKDWPLVQFPDNLPAMNGPGDIGSPEYNQKLVNYIDETTNRQFPQWAWDYERARVEFAKRAMELNVR